MGANTDLLRVILFDVAALLAVIGFVYGLLKNKQEKLDTRFRVNEEKINELSASCVRREENTAAIQTAIGPVNHQQSEIRHQLSEIRHRIDDLFSLQKNKKA